MPQSQPVFVIEPASFVVGTPAFMAPETISRSNPDHRVATYAVGCVGYWLLTGTLVFVAARCSFHRNRLSFGYC